MLNFGEKSTWYMWSISAISGVLDVQLVSLQVLMKAKIHIYNFHEDTGTKFRRKRWEKCKIHQTADEMRLERVLERLERISQDWTLPTRAWSARRAPATIKTQIFTVLGIFLTLGNLGDLCPSIETQRRPFLTPLKQFYQESSMNHSCNSSLILIFCISVMSN